eukprot:363149-Chlamydomonas_euryale.AAC.4
MRPLLSTRPAATQAADCACRSLSSPAHPPALFQSLPRLNSQLRPLLHASDAEGQGLRRRLGLANPRPTVRLSPRRALAASVPCPCPASSRTRRPRSLEKLPGRPPTSSRAAVIKTDGPTRCPPLPSVLISDK